MKVWASTAGSADMNISVKDGMANLHLDFQLGFPGQAHLPPPPQDFQTTPRYKTPARKAKDRARAAAHQLAKPSQPLSKSADPATPLKTPTLPFHRITNQSDFQIIPRTAQLEAVSAALLNQAAQHHPGTTDPVLPNFQAVRASSTFQAASVLTIKAAPASTALQAAPASTALQAAPASTAIQTTPASTTFQAAPASLSIQTAPVPPQTQTKPDQKAVPSTLQEKSTQTQNTVKQQSTSTVAPSYPPESSSSTSSAATPSCTKAEQDQARITRRVISQANHVNESMTYGKIGYSQYYSDIQDDFFKTIECKASEFVDNEPKIKETLIKIARSYKVRI